MMPNNELLERERIPLQARDKCAHLLVEMNRCRRKTLYLPFKCTHEKHEYEQCLYADFLERAKQLEQLKKDQLLSKE